MNGIKYNIKILEKTTKPNAVNYASELIEQNLMLQPFNLEETEFSKRYEVINNLISQRNEQVYEQIGGLIKGKIRMLDRMILKMLKS